MNKYLKGRDFEYAHLLLSRLQEGELDRIVEIPKTDNEIINGIIDAASEISLRLEDIEKFDNFGVTRDQRANRKRRAIRYVKLNDDIGRRIEKLKYSFEKYLSDPNSQHTELMKNELLLSSQREILNQVAIVAETDSRGNITYVNQKFLDISKYTEDELIGENHRILNSGFHPKDFFINMWKTIQSGKIWRDVIKNKAKDGTYYWVDSTICPQLNNEGKVYKYTAIRFDVTEKKQNELIFQSAIETTNVGFWLVNLQGVIINVNQAYEVMSGYSKSELIQMKISDLEANENPDEIASHIKQVMIQGFDRFETIHRKKNGELVEIEVSVSYINEQGGLLAVFSMDISERKKMLVTLENQKNCAEKLARVKSNFLANMSHELRSPLNSIIGISDLLMDTQLTTEQKNYVSIFQKACETLIRTVNDILDLSKIESEHFTSLSEHISLKKIIEEVEQLFNIRATNKNLKFQVVKNFNQEKYVLGDQLKILQVLMNLTDNAIKFTERGQVTLRVTDSVVFKNWEEYIQYSFEIEDTGIGIDEECQKKLFNSFVQADMTISRRYGGTGLGLAISKKIIELFGGTITIDSKPGKGSIFSFTILLKNSSSHNVIHNVAEKIKTPSLHYNVCTTDRQKKILLVDDSADNRLLFRAFVKKFEVYIEEAENGEEAVKKFESSCFDLVFMDLQMPIMDGLKATETIRFNESIKAKKPVPIIAFSAHVLQEEVNKCFQSGCNDYLPKPVRKADIEKILMKYLT